MKVVVASGHMVDRPDRSEARFPESSVRRVSLELRRQLARWAVGPGDTLICGGASGADLLAAEAALDRGVGVHLLLASPIDEFERSSVRGQAWLDRFRSVCNASHVTELASGESNRYEAANLAMLAEARAFPTIERFGLLVWDGQVSNRPGGTDHMARLLTGDESFTTYGIDPTPRPSADRQWAEGPKRVLTLDGGGIRGVLSLGILSCIEEQLRVREGRTDLVLADYFDYIAGTSTGAIIATALSLGLPVAEIERQYREMGKRVFRRQPTHRRLVSVHPSDPLREELDALIGSDTTLGDAALRTLLTIVLHNTDTDSPWPLSNCPSAKYNRPERALAPLGSDRNLDLSLPALIVGSAAAPYYFRAQNIAVGPRIVNFQDGGVTPYNNPAALLFTMTTLPEYEVEWLTGADQMLIVSVGTGLSSKPAPNTRLFPRRLATLPAVFMNGAAASQDLQCRSIAQTRFGGPIDAESGSMPNGHQLFTYVRYNAPLQPAKWFEAELRGFPNGDDGASTANRIWAIGADRLGKLNSIKHVDDLFQLGRLAGQSVNATTHFAGF